ncbi:50S ribosomal protein L23 [Thioalkalicoccus limnaeus]|uniref:Large ribosomal subunit protein uL23 n=1 Tax=Thioalkalicoccus limnaeus TaxID=120681 RepID=A0ABV4B9W0_9GAMM
MNQERLAKVLLSPVVSEKAARGADFYGQYAFRVLPDATKEEIAKAVEQMFDVAVDGVQVLNVKGKKKRFGQRFGRRRDWRKAYVRLAPGHSIDFGGGA